MVAGTLGTKTHHDLDIALSSLEELGIKHPSNVDRMRDLFFRLVERPKVDLLGEVLQHLDSEVEQLVEDNYEVEAVAAVGIVLRAAIRRLRRDPKKRNEYYARALIGLLPEGAEVLRKEL